MLCLGGRGSVRVLLCFFFFNDTATTEIYTLSLHDALPIYGLHQHLDCELTHRIVVGRRGTDRKSTRLNSSHQKISYAVFCLKKKKQQLFKRKSRKKTERRGNRREQVGKTG